MKKLISFLFFFTFLLTSYAQGLRFGFQMSPTFSWMGTNISHIEKNGSNLGVKLGIIGDFYFAENYALSTGVGFHFNAGGTLLHRNVGKYWPNSDIPSSIKSDSMTFAAGTNLKYNIQYLEIPFGLKMRTREFGYLRYFLEPLFALGIKTQVRGTISGPDIPDDGEKYDIGAEVNNLNLSLGIGGGVEYSISESSSLVGGLFFQSGFADVTDDRNGQYYDMRDENKLKDEKSKGKIGSLTIMLGIIF